MVDDVDELLRKQTRIDGVAHRSNARHAEVQLEVPVRVPGQRAHPVAVGDAQPQQGVGQLLAAGVGSGVAVAVHAPLGQARHNFGIGVPLGGVFEEASDAELARPS